MMVDDARLRMWTDHLESLARRSLADVDLAALLDEALTNRDSLRAPLLLHLSSKHADRPDHSLPDVALWWSVVDGGSFPPMLVDVKASGPLFEQGDFTTIEVWTETELAALHAMGHFPDPSVRDRVRRAIDWHLEYTQPDNATNHPWAIHLFLTHGSAEGVHLAEMQLNNCQVMNVNPDVMSALILRDAAACLQHLHHD